MYKTDVLMIIKTNGLDYDDRLRKECLTISDLNCSVKIAVLEHDNQERHGLTDYNILFNSIQLTSRKLFEHKRALAAKLIEMYTKFLLQVLKNRPRIVWIHNWELAGLVGFLWILRKFRFIEKVVWDQHELIPHRFSGDRFLKNWSKLLIKCSDTIITANKERREHTLSSLHIDDNSNFVVMENYCYRRFIDSQSDKLPPHLNLIERFRGHLKRSAIHNYYFETVEKAIMKAVEILNRQKNHPLRPHLKTAQNLLKAAWS